MAVQCVLDVSTTMGLPNAASQDVWPTRDEWSVEYVQEGHEGLIGLSNLGNTCYQNAIIQCLLNNKYFVTQLQQHVTAGDDHMTTTTTTDSATVANQFLLLLRTYHQSHNSNTTHCGSIRAEGIRDSMAKRHVTLGDGRQHDAQEFLALLLDALHEQLRRNAVTNDNKRLKVCETRDDNNASDEEMARREWNKYKLLAGHSCVVDAFQGQLCSAVTCDHCCHVSKTFEPFMYLALPLPFARQKTFTSLVFTSLQCVSTRVSLTVDDKYDSVLQLKRKLRHVLSLDESIEDTDLLVVEVCNGFTVARIIDDSDHILSLNESNTCRIHVFQLNQLNDVTQHVEARVCIICLDEKPLAQLLRHSGACANGHICEQCLDAACKHYSNDCPRTAFRCPACSADVTKHSFTQCQRASDRHFPIPVLFRARGENNANQLIHRVLMIRVSAQIDSSHIYALVDARVPNPEHTYRLVFVDRDGLGCCRCSWGSSCDGCEVSRDGVVTLCESDSICVTFETIPQIGVSFDVFDDKSFTEPKDTKERLDLDTCLRAFIANECLDDNNDNNSSNSGGGWFCAHCQQLRPAHKSLHIVRAPHTLIVYLKRFLFISNNSYKLEESVSFPLDRPLDIGPLLCPGSSSSYAQTNNNTNNSNNEQQSQQSFVYSLDAFVCHVGTVTSGHYTCYVRKESQWFHYNDDVVTQQRPDDDDARAYILFYTRVEPNDPFAPEVAHEMAAAADGCEQPLVERQSSTATTNTNTIDDNNVNNNNDNNNSDNSRDN